MTQAGAAPARQARANAGHSIIDFVTKAHDAWSQAQGI